MELTFPLPKWQNNAAWQRDACPGNVPRLVDGRLVEWKDFLTSPIGNDPNVLTAMDLIGAIGSNGMVINDDLVRLIPREFDTGYALSSNHSKCNALNLVFTFANNFWDGTWSQS